MINAATKYITSWCLFADVDAAATEEVVVSGACTAARVTVIGRRASHCCRRQRPIDRRPDGSRAGPQRAGYRSACPPASCPTVCLSEGLSRRLVVFAGRLKRFGGRRDEVSVGEFYLSKGREIRNFPVIFNQLCRVLHDLQRWHHPSFNDFTSSVRYCLCVVITAVKWKG